MEILLSICELDLKWSFTVPEDLWFVLLGTHCNIYSARPYIEGMYKDWCNQTQSMPLRPTYWSLTLYCNITTQIIPPIKNVNLRTPVCVSLCIILSNNHLLPITSLLLNNLTPFYRSYTQEQNDVNINMKCNENKNIVFILHWQIFSMTKVEADLYFWTYMYLKDSCELRGVAHGSVVRNSKVALTMHIM